MLKNIALFTISMFTLACGDDTTIITTFSTISGIYTNVTVSDGEIDTFESTEPTTGTTGELETADDTSGSGSGSGDATGCVPGLPQPGDAWGACVSDDPNACPTGQVCSTFTDSDGVTLLGTMCIPDDCGWDRVGQHCPTVQLDGCKGRLGAIETVCSSDNPLRDSACIVACDPLAKDPGCEPGLVCLGDRCLHPSI